jgi:hypothetical protein
VGGEECESSVEGREEREDGEVGAVEFGEGAIAALFSVAVGLVDMRDSGWKLNVYALVREDEENCNASAHY